MSDLSGTKQKEPLLFSVGKLFVWTNGPFNKQSLFCFFSSHANLESDAECLIKLFRILKVGSCPKNDKYVQFSFVLFCVAYKCFCFQNLFLQRKPQDFAENAHFFVCLFPLCWNFNSKNSFVTCA